MLPVSQSLQAGVCLSSREVGVAALPGSLPPPQDKTVLTSAGQHACSPNLLRLVRSWTGGLRGAQVT